MKPRLIIFEGLPGTGKSTAAAMLSAELEKRKIKVFTADEGCEDHPADYKDYDFPDFETERRMILDKWREFVSIADRETVYVFNCIFLQNPMCEAMMRFGMSEEKCLEYISEIADIIKCLDPVIIYIDSENAKDTVDAVLSERGNGWLGAVIDYHTSQGYGKDRGLSGYEGYISCLEERRRRELEILDALEISSVVTDRKGISDIIKTLTEECLNERNT